MNKRTAGALAIGKLVRHSARLRGSGGSALPGLVVEKIHRDFLPEMLADLPDGVIIVTGTNGKTTTTKMIAELLASLGKTVLTNDTGSNFTRGIVASIVKEAKVGRPLHHDIAVIELDEAYARKFVKTVKPSYVVALNIMRDQLDRFGEIDTTAKMVQSVLEAATKGCVINGNDPHLHAIGDSLKVPVSYYTVDKTLRKLFPSDAELLAVSTHEAPTDKTMPTADVELLSSKKQEAEYKIEGRKYTQTLKVTGLYNFQNAAAAIAMARLINPSEKAEMILRQLGSVAPAFGRGETFTLHGQPLEMVLVKNPAGFRLALKSFTTPADIMIAINDQHADGRDMSWLWDVDFESLGTQSVKMVSGIRAYDMALRLRYDGISAAEIITDLDKALAGFIKNSPGPKRIFCTYTAMLSLHAKLAKMTGKERTL